MIRAFIAVPMPPEVVRAATDMRTRCSKIRGAVRWVAPEKIHLTLKFLGDMDADRVAPVGKALAGVAAAAGAFRLAAGGLGVFPSVKRPRVLWMGIRGETAPLIVFARQLDDALTGLGFAAERRPFKAHLTLGRFTAKCDPRQLADTLLSAADADAVPFSAGRVILFQSELKPSGAVYTPLAAVPLTGGDEWGSRAPGCHS